MGDTELATAALFATMDDPATGPADRDGLRARIIELNLPFAARLAHRYRNRGQDVDDLEQVAALALVKAVDGFDPRRGSPFFGYLIPTVVGEVKRHFRDKGWTMHVSRGLQERHLEFVRARASLMQQLRRTPTVGDLAAALEITQEEVLATWAAGNAYDVDSLNSGVSAVADAVERQDLVGADDPDLISACDRLALRELLRRLPEREHFVVTQYFFGDATQEQIAGAIGMSQMNVSRLLRRTLQSLRRQLDGETDDRPAVVTPAGISIYVKGQRAVVTIAGDIDAGAAAQLRDVLVDTAVQERPRHLVVDLRGAGAAGAETVRALVDGYRAGGHTGTTLAVFNVPAELFRLLTHLGVTRLFCCRPAGQASLPAMSVTEAEPATAAVACRAAAGLAGEPAQSVCPPAPAPADGAKTRVLGWPTSRWREPDPVPSGSRCSEGGPRPLGVGWHPADVSGAGSDIRRRPGDDRLSGHRPGSGRPPPRAGCGDVRGSRPDRPGGRRHGRRPACDQLGAAARSP
ncbi:SigB/SigF/SigG family RNA polymerase sigma factor [Actinoplanes sp. NPDC026619]|uniref:SigB/SigF/SigG family RNA polymerase sigma factor n=1 Tax=Actinoplanes sp. NPDC026619 TaxID=3155798 RepID=UPI0033CB9030